jgi:large subunit ribosomal protein L30e
VIDIDKAIASAVKTGKVAFGTELALQNVKTGKAKMIILAANCPKTFREDIEFYANLSKVPLITHKGSSLDLAALCGKPFSVSALSIREPGDSDILRLTEEAVPDESNGGNE